MIRLKTLLISLAFISSAHADTPKIYSQMMVAALIVSVDDLRLYPYLLKDSADETLRKRFHNIQTMLTTFEDSNKRCQVVN